MIDERLRAVLDELAGDMYSDYVKSSESRVIRARDELYEKYYVVKPFNKRRQTRPVVFVDGGFVSFETDVSILIVAVVGAEVRDVDGELKAISEVTDYPPVNEYFIYGRVIPGDGVDYKLKIYPVDEYSAVIDDSNKDEVSAAITGLINEKAARGAGPRGAILLKKLVKYVEGLLEVAYALKVSSAIAVDPVIVVDGTLARWFSVERSRFFGFDGLDLLAAMTRLDKPVLREKLRDVYGLVKSAKFTAIARARRLIDKYSSVKGTMAGHYTTITPTSAELATEYLNKLMSDGSLTASAAAEAVGTLNRVIHPYNGVYSARFPLTGDGKGILHFEIHIDRPIIRIDNGRAVCDVDAAAEASTRAEAALNEIMTYRTAIYGYPPFGFPEVDEAVRVPRNVADTIEMDILSALLRKTKKGGHVLEMAFPSVRRIYYRIYDHYYPGVSRR